MEEPHCLLCGGQSIKMIKLLDDEESTVTFALVAEFEVTEDDFLCRSCNNKLQIVCEFREKCLSSEACNLRRQRVVIKDEEPDETMITEDIEVSDMIEEYVDSEEDQKIIVPDNEVEFMLAKAINKRQLLKGAKENEPKHPLYMESDYDERTCSFCFQKFDSTDALKTHETSHAQELTPFSCFRCSKKFRRRDQLKEHFNLHTNSMYACTYEGCTKQYWSKHSFASHLETHSNVVHFCAECGKYFATKALMRSHVKQVHTESSTWHDCDFCGKSFKNNKMLYCHRQLHLREKSFKCGECSKKFITNAKLKRHVNQVHVEEKPLKCPLCNYSTASNSNLKRHSLRHTNDAEN